MKLLNGFSLLLLEEIGQPIQPLIPFLLSSSQIKLEKMSPDNIPEKPDTNADNQTSGSRKTASPRPPEQPLLCPRCNSPNTKFCYFNNYNLTQPRHFCKTCRRYWTKGGALRNVPVGGGCRKNKRIKSASRLSGSSKDFAASSDSGVLKFFHGLSPAMEFQLGEGFPFSRHHFVSYGDLSTAPAAAATAAVINPSCFYIDDAVASSGSLMGLNSNPSVLKQGESGGFNFNGGIQEMGSMNVQSSLASSIESLSCINQDLHWKLQQQRLATIFGGECEKDGGVSSLPPTLQENLTQKPQPISFQKLEISKQLVSAVSDPTNSGVSGPATTEGFFENSNNPATTNSNSSSSNWNGIQHWTDLHQYSEFP